MSKKINSSDSSIDLNWVFGTCGDDDLKGTKGTETTDIFFGFGGNDKFVGFDGNDYIFGCRGDDTLLGGRGDDFISGGRGNDFISGGLGNDRLFGGSGDDVLIDYQGDNYLNGGRGDDTLIVGHGDSVLVGGRGSDTFVLTNRLPIGVPDQPVDSNDIEIKAEIVDFNFGVDKIRFDLGQDTNDDGARDAFLDAIDDFSISFNNWGDAVFTNTEFQIELTLNGLSASDLAYATNNDIDLFVFS